MNRRWLRIRKDHFASILLTVMAVAAAGLAIWMNVG